MSLFQSNTVYWLSQLLFETVAIVVPVLSLIERQTFQVMFATNFREKTEQRLESWWLADCHLSSDSTRHKKDHVHSERQMREMWFTGGRESGYKVKFSHFWWKGTFASNSDTWLVNDGLNVRLPKFFWPVFAAVVADSVSHDVQEATHYACYDSSKKIVNLKISFYSIICLPACMTVLPFQNIRSEFRVKGFGAGLSRDEFLQEAARHGLQLWKIHPVAIKPCCV